MRLYVKTVNMLLDSMQHASSTTAQLELARTIATLLQFDSILRSFPENGAEKD